MDIFYYNTPIYKEILLKFLQSTEKPFILVAAISFSFFRKAFIFGGNHCPQLKPILKPILFSGNIVEAAPFNRNFSF